jgi:NADH:quinone reductase (non-electrogenic)
MPMPIGKARYVKPERCSCFGLLSAGERLNGEGPELQGGRVAAVAPRKSPGFFPSVANGNLRPRLVTPARWRASERSAMTRRDLSASVPTVLVVGGGYAGYHFARQLEHRLPTAVNIVLASPVDYLLYTALLPQVAAGVLEPRHLAVGLRSALRRARLELGHVVDIDLNGRSATVLRQDDTTVMLSWDRLVLAPGSVTRLFDIPGVSDHAHGLKSLAEAVALRDHVLRQLERADLAEDPDERSALCTFVVVGAGYSGTEVAAQMQAVTQEAARRYPRLQVGDPRWVLLDVANRVLPELDPRLSDGAETVLRARGVDVRLKTSVASATSDVVTLTDGTVIPAHTLVWTAGVTPSPLIETLGLPTERGRLTVDAAFQVPGRPDVFALGDAAAVPDLTQPKGALTAQTAQHAQRQGKAAARNVAASLGFGRMRPYRHRDLGFVVDLGGLSAVANPLHLPLSGPSAAAVTRAYHLLALPKTSNRARVALDWILNAAQGPQLVRLGFVPPSQWTVTAAESTTLVGGAWRQCADSTPRRTVQVSDHAVPDTAHSSAVRS